MQNTFDLTNIIKPEYMHFYSWEPLPQTKLYDIAKENNLLLDKIPNKFFEVGKFTHQYLLNIKEESITNKEFSIVCKQFEAFQKKYNRI